MPKLQAMTDNEAINAKLDEDDFAGRVDHHATVIPSKEYEAWQNSRERRTRDALRVAVDYLTPSGKVRPNPRSPEEVLREIAEKLEV